jgi:hypothetical protein
LLIDALAAIALLAAGALLLANLLAAVAQQKRELEQRTAATQFAANLLERELAKPWDEVKSQPQIEIDDEIARLLPKAEAAIGIDTTPSEKDLPEGKKIVVSVMWGKKEAVTARSARLIGWKFAREGTKP